MGDYLSDDIETPDDVAMLEDRVVGTAAKLVYFNTIRNQLRSIKSGQQQPAPALAHLDALAGAWMAKGTAPRSQKGATMATALAGRWRNWQARGAPLGRAAAPRYPQTAFRRECPDYNPSTTLPAHHWTIHGMPRRRPHPSPGRTAPRMPAVSIPVPTTPDFWICPPARLL